MLRRLFCAAVAVLVSTGVAAGQKAVLDEALRGTGASAVLMDVRTGRLLAKTGPEAAALPGSTLKPFILYLGLDARLVQPGTTVECRGNLAVGGRNLACTHPRDVTVFDGRAALAYSCNTYFARLAERMSDFELRMGLVRFGLPSAESDGSPEGRVLTALGVVGARVTPLQMAQAYRILASRATPVVMGGLEDSVQFGMADNARMPGLVGKTGTVKDPGQSWTHGWFAGVASGKTVVVVYVPRGSGADAAGLGRRVVEGLGR
jgi:cell division protein FtsI/penicillin-binding protein 2